MRVCQLGAERREREREGGRKVCLTSPDTRLKAELREDQGVFLSINELKGIKPFETAELGRCCHPVVKSIQFTNNITFPVELYIIDLEIIKLDHDS